MATMDSGQTAKGAMLHAPAADRNKKVILDQLQFIVAEKSKQGTKKMLEIASGSGQHAAYFAKHLKNVDWTPSECDPASLDSIRAYRDKANLPNLQPVLNIDVTSKPDSWGLPGKVDFMLCVNLIHISPWEATVGLFKGAAHLLEDSGCLITYGPYAFNKRLSPESNRRFDSSLRAQNSSWGIRDVVDLDELASAIGLTRLKTIAVPANNHILVYSKT